MLVLNCQIDTPRTQLKTVKKINIFSSKHEMTDRCEILLPSKGFFKEKLLKTLFVYGEPIEVKMGYGDELNTIFQGFISEVNAGTPLTLQAEDAMFLLKKIPTKPVVLENAFLPMVMGHLLYPLYFSLENHVPLGTFTIYPEDDTVAKVLQKLKDRYGFSIFFRNNLLNICKEKQIPNPKIHNLNVQRHLLSDQLCFDFKSGLAGDFTIFGTPFIRHGDHILLEDEQFEKMGLHSVKSVNYQFGEQGFRQKVGV